MKDLLEFDRIAFHWLDQIARVAHDLASTMQAMKADELLQLRSLCIGMGRGLRLQELGVCRLQPGLDGIVQTLRSREDLLELVIRDAPSGVIARYVALLGEGKNSANGLAVRLDGAFQRLNPHVMAC